MKLIVSTSQEFSHGEVVSISGLPFRLVLALGDCRVFEPLPRLDIIPTAELDQSLVMDFSVPELILNNDGGG